MENKEMKKSIPVELDDEHLDNVSGGIEVRDPVLSVMPMISDIEPHVWEDSPETDIPEIPVDFGGNAV